MLHTQKVEGGKYKKGLGLMSRSTHLYNNTLVCVLTYLDALEEVVSILLFFICLLVRVMSQHFLSICKQIPYISQQPSAPTLHDKLSHSHDSRVSHVTDCDNSHAFLMSWMVAR